MRRLISMGILLLAMARDLRAADIDDCLRTFVDLDSVRALVAAKSVASLNEIRSKTDFRSSVTASIYALRLYEISKTRENESRLIESIPRSEVELFLLYWLTHRDVELRERPDLFSDYMQAVYTVVRRSRRSYGRFLRLGALAQGGDLGETLSSYIESLYDSDASGVDRALLSLPEAERNLVCGEEAVPCPRAKLYNHR
jgi:hypothetical protein